MGSEIAIIGSEVAKHLLRLGFQLKGIREGKYITVYDFEDCPTLEKVLTDMFSEKEG